MYIQKKISTFHFNSKQTIGMPYDLYHYIIISFFYWEKKHVVSYIRQRNIALFIKK